MSQLWEKYCTDKQKDKRSDRMTVDNNSNFIGPSTLQGTKILPSQRLRRSGIYINFEHISRLF